MSANNLRSAELYSGSVDLLQLKDGVRLTHENGLRLLKDARTLFKKESYPSTVTLAQLAIEEFGKELMLRAYAIGDRPDHISFFWMRFRNHKSKAAVGALPELWGPDMFDEEKLIALAFDPSKDYGRVHNDIKDGSIYVEMVEPGWWQAPASIVNKEFAEKMLDRASDISSKTEKLPSKFRMR